LATKENFPNFRVNRPSHTWELWSRLHFQKIKKTSLHKAVTAHRTRRLPARKSNNNVKRRDDTAESLPQKTKEQNFHQVEERKITIFNPGMLKTGKIQPSYSLLLETKPASSTCDKPLLDWTYQR
ncbi:MAG: hypothetical protein GY696_11950, partial [Gammaproteobacteria bacterium]|nr:hypothetical protein [Gammaproteobacteria bacterium]